MTMSDKTKCLCSKCPIERECIDHECEVHDKLNADLDAARAELSRYKLAVQKHFKAICKQ